MPRVCGDSWGGRGCFLKVDTKYLDAHLVTGPNDKFYESNNALGRVGPSPAVALMMGDATPPSTTPTTTTTTTNNDGTTTTMKTETVTVTGGGANEEAAAAVAPTMIELHGYQADFLQRAAAAQGLADDGAALQKLVKTGAALTRHPLLQNGHQLLQNGHQLLQDASACSKMASSCSKMAVSCSAVQLGRCPLCHSSADRSALSQPG